MPGALRGAAPRAAVFAGVAPAVFRAAEARLFFLRSLPLVILVANLHFCDVLQTSFVLISSSTFLPFMSDASAGSLFSPAFPPSSAVAWEHICDDIQSAILSYLDYRALGKFLVTRNYLSGECPLVPFEHAFDISIECEEYLEPKIVKTLSSFDAVFRVSAYSGITDLDVMTFLATKTTGTFTTLDLEVADTTEQAIELLLQLVPRASNLKIWLPDSAPDDVNSRIFAAVSNDVKSFTLHVNRYHDLLFADLAGVVERCFSLSHLEFRSERVPSPVNGPHSVTRLVKADIAAGVYRRDNNLPALVTTLQIQSKLKPNTYLSYGEDSVKVGPGFSISELLKKGIPPTDIPRIRNGYWPAIATSQDADFMVDLAHLFFSPRAYSDVYDEDYYRCIYDIAKHTTKLAKFVIASLFEPGSERNIIPLIVHDGDFDEPAQEVQDKIDTALASLVEPYFCLFPWIFCMALEYSSFDLPKTLAAFQAALLKALEDSANLNLQDHFSYLFNLYCTGLRTPVCYYNVDDAGFHNYKDNQRAMELCIKLEKEIMAFVRHNPSRLSIELDHPRWFYVEHDMFEESEMKRYFLKRGRTADRVIIE